MSVRAEAGGDMVIVRGKIASRYDPSVEREVLGWLKELIQVDIEPGMRSVEKSLKSGNILLKLAKVLQKGSPNCPPKAARMKLKENPETNVAFKEMENIENFLAFCEKFGVPRTSMFQTVDLYEGRNMAQVLSCLQILSTEAQRWGFSGSKIGPKPADKHARNFSAEDMRKGHTIIGLQAGSNKFATQKGMRIGSVRHVADIRADDLLKVGTGFLTLQSGTNKFATQKGMRIGSVRHGGDIRADDLLKEGSGFLTLQAGTNKFATQAGMRIGSVRHGSDIRADDLLKEGQAVIGLQAGTNKCATQSSCNIVVGGVRHGADIRADDLVKEGQAIVGLQAGTNKLATQSSCNIVVGGVRHVADIRADDLTREGSAVIGLQMGTNQYATQTGMRIGGVRHVADIRADDSLREGASYINLQMGTNRYASQHGMSSFGAVRHVGDLKVHDSSKELPDLTRINEYVDPGVNFCHKEGQKESHGHSQEA